MKLLYFFFILPFSFFGQTFNFDHTLNYFKVQNGILSKYSVAINTQNENYFLIIDKNEKESYQVILFEKHLDNEKQNISTFDKHYFEFDPSKNNKFEYLKTISPKSYTLNNKKHYYTHTILYKSRNILVYKDSIFEEHLIRNFNLNDSIINSTIKINFEKNKELKVKNQLNFLDNILHYHIHLSDYNQDNLFRINTISVNFNNKNNIYLELENDYKHSFSLEIKNKNIIKFENIYQDNEVFYIEKNSENQRIINEIKSGKIKIYNR